MGLEKLLDEVAAEGRRDSGGGFTIDLERALQLLGRYQLADPHAYVRTVVAAAVTGGASFLEITTRLGICRFRFDGRTLNQEQMGRLPSLEGDEFERSLSLMLLQGLSMKPRWLHFYSNGASLSLRGRAPKAADGVSSVLVLGPLEEPTAWLRRLFTCQEQKFLINFCHLAPLRLTLNGKSINRHLNFGECLAAVYVGDGATLPVRLSTAGRPRSALAPGRWSAVLAIGSKERRNPVILVDGVGYPPPFSLPYPGSRGLIQAPGMPLDASRAQLVDGDALRKLRQEVEAELDELALELALGGNNAILAALLARHVPRLWACEKYPLGARLREVPVFARLDGSPVTVGQLVEQITRDGYIGASRKIWPGAPSSLILLSESSQEALRCFNWIQLDHLTGSTTTPRLPEGDFILRVPLASGAGEAGLTITPEVQSSSTLPPGVQLAPPGLATEHHVYPTLPILYKGLMWIRPTPARASDHLLAYFHKLVQCAHVDTLRQLLDPSAPILSTLNQLPLGGRLDAEDLKKMASRVIFPTCGGSQVTLADLSQESSRLFRIHPGGPPEALLLSAFQWRLLQVVYRPGQLKSHGVNVASSYFTNCAHEAHHFRSSLRIPVGTAHFLLALLAQPTCAAVLFLRELNIDLEELRVVASKEGPEGTKTPVSDLGLAVLQQADLSRYTFGIHYCTSDILLWACLKVDNCSAQRCLLRCGLDLATWERHVKMHPFREVIIELDEAIASYPCAVDLARRGIFRAARNEFESAEADARRAVGLDPHNPRPHRAFSTIRTLQGQFPLAIESARRALELDPESADIYLDVSENLILLGQLEEAESLIAESLRREPDSAGAFSGQAQVAFARDQWGEALGLCQKALDRRSDIGWALETRAHSLRLLGRHEEALEAYGKFLERAEFPLFEARVAARIQEARAWSLLLKRDLQQLPKQT